MTKRNSYGDEYSETKNDCWIGLSGHENHGPKNHLIVFEIEKDFWKYWGIDFRFRWLSNRGNLQLYLDLELAPIISIGIGWLGFHLQLGPCHLFVGDIF